MQKIITIFGTSNAKPDDKTFKTAYKLGKSLAQAGFAVANGGYGGIMLASAKGASQAGGKAIGVTCTAFGRSGANKYVTDEIVTNSLQQRLEKLIALGDAYIALPGGTGTLLELAQVWELKNKGFIGNDKPVIIIGDFWKPLLAMIEIQDKESTKQIDIVGNIDEVLEILNKHL